MTGTRNLKMWLTMCSLMLVLVSAATADTHYVSPGGSIQAAINAAAPGDQIEVAPGTYNEAINFHGKAVKLYSSGGPGATTIDATGLDASVVTCKNSEGSGTILEGFTITGGRGTRLGIDSRCGGGMCNENSSPKVIDCIFTRNVVSEFWHPTGYGGGMYNKNSSPEVIDCIFSLNGGYSPHGGGMYNIEDSNPTVTNCSFSESSADRGAGMSNYYSHPTVTNCSFSKNSGTGGAMFNSQSNPTVLNCTVTGNSGGAAMHNWVSSPTVRNCTFTANSGKNGGAMCNSDGSSPKVTNCTFIGNQAFDPGRFPYGGSGGAMYNAWPSSPTVTNCTFKDNHAGGLFGKFGWGGGMCNDLWTKVTVTNCIFWGNTADAGGQEIWGPATVTYSDMKDGYTGTGNINQDPLFAANAGVRLSPGSPCINAGDNSAVPADVMTDLDGNPRIISGTVDMGAYESGVKTLHVPIPYQTIQSAIEAAIPYYSQIEVAPGTYYEAINFKGKAIRLYSKGGPQVTIINGNGADHVVQCVNLERSSTILEGFTITGGNANGSSPHDCGGGMYNQGSHPTVTNCIFTGNFATKYGGGMFNENACDPTVTNCTFIGNAATNGGGGGMASSTNCAGTLTDCTFQSNTATGFGGGMLNDAGSSGRLIRCTFSSNTASAAGGGICNRGYSNPRLTDCSFSGNRATRLFGGGMYNEFNSIATMTNCSLRSNSAGQFGGGIANYNQSKAILTNCILIGNSVPSGGRGGGMYNLQSQATLTNCTFTGNLAPMAYAGGIGNVNSSVTLTNCILWGDSKPEINTSATVNYSDIENGWAGTGNINANPKFADGAGRLAPTSPCIDVGYNPAVSGVATDLDGKPRITDGNLDGVPRVDMGAYEYVSVDADADGIKDSVDAAPLVYSNGFADGSTTGTIIDRADQLLVIADAPAPHGVWIEASASGGPTPAQVSVCGGAVLTLGAGDVALVTCGSIEITVVQGTVEIVFTATDGTQAQTTLNKGNAIAFDPETCTITAPATNVYNVVVIVNGGQIVLAPGESKTLAQVVDIDIYPNRTPNRVFLSRNYTLYVAVLGSDTFDVTTLNSATVKFGKTGTEASPMRAPLIRDLNSDGKPDAMYGFRTFNCNFALGDTQGWLKGSTASGTPVEGSDSVLVLP